MWCCWLVTPALVALSFAVLVLYFLRRSKNDGNKQKQIGTNAQIPGLEPSHSEEGNKAEIVLAGGVTPFLAELHRKLGPIVSFWEGKNLVVSLASPKLLRATRHLNFKDDAPAAPFKAVLGDDCFTYVGVEEHKRRKRIYEPYFLYKSVKKFFSCFHEIAQETICEWSKLSADDHVQLVTAINATAMKAILRTCYGDYFKDEKHLSDFQAKYDHASSYAYGKRNAKDANEAESVKKKIAEVRSLLHDIIEARKEEKEDEDDEEEEAKVFMDVLLRSDISEEQRVSDGLGFIMGAYNDLGTVVALSLYELANQAPIQEKLFHEIQTVLGETGRVSEHNFEKLVYTRQVLDEVLRKGHHAPYLSRILEEEMELEGYLVPSGTTIYLNYDFIFRDPQIWDNPDKFDPDHFSPSNVKSRDPYAFKPFGSAGKRACPGYMFAYTEATTMVVEFCRHFRFRLVPGQNVDRVSQEIWVTLEKRKQ